MLIQVTYKNTDFGGSFTEYLCDSMVRDQAIDSVKAAYDKIKADDDVYMVITQEGHRVEAV